MQGRTQRKYHYEETRRTEGKDEDKAYGDVEVHCLLGKCGHFIVEAEAVFSYALRRKDDVRLSFFGAIGNDLLIGANNGVVDIEGATSLNLDVNK